MVEKICRGTENLNNLTNWLVAFLRLMAVPASEDTSHKEGAGLAVHLHTILQLHHVLCYFVACLGQQGLAHTSIHTYLSGVFGFKDPDSPITTSLERCESRKGKSMPDPSYQLLQQL